MFTIKEVCHLTGLSRKAVLYYENHGLICPSERSASGYRLYSHDDVEKLKVIRNLRSIQFSVNEVKRLLAPDIEEDTIKSYFNRRRNALLMESNNYYILAKKIEHVEKAFDQYIYLGNENIKIRDYSSKSALLVFNMQNDFIYGSLRSSDVDTIVPVVRNLLVSAWQNNIPIIHVCDSHMPEKTPEWKIWGPHAAEGSLGADLIKLLQSIPYEYMIKKQGYSAFYDTNLQEILDFWDIRNLFLCGVYTEVALFQSTLDAFHRGYRLWLIEDAITGHQRAGHENSMENMEAFCGAKIISSAKTFRIFQDPDTFFGNL